VQTQTIDYDPDIFQKSHQSEADKALMVKFLVKPFPNQTASAQEGRPIFTEREYVDIKGPGTHVCRPAEPKDMARFPDHYRAFRNRTSIEGVQGTMLVEWPLMTRSQADELAFLNVKTVEQLAAMSDGMAGKMMNFYAMKRKANEWLEVSKNNAAAMQLKDELHKRDLQITALIERVAELETAKPPSAIALETPRDEVAELRAMVEQLAKNMTAPVAQVIETVPVIEKRKAGRPKVIKTE
jgi:hypothetical protein